MPTCTNAFTPTGDTANTNSYTSPSFTPVEGDLLVAFVSSSDTVAAGAMSASANGITFARMPLTAVRGSGAHQLYGFIANQPVPASPSAMTITFTCTGDNATGAIVQCCRVDGMTRFGLNAIRQIAKDDEVTSGTAPATVFDRNCLSVNPTLWAIGNPQNAPFYTATTNWTKQTDASYATPTTGGAYQTRNSGFTGATITSGDSTVGLACALAVELDASRFEQGFGVQMA